MNKSKNALQSQVSKVENTTADLNLLVGSMLHLFAKLADCGLNPAQQVLALEMSERAQEYLAKGEKQMTDFAELQRMVDGL